MMNHSIICQLILSLLSSSLLTSIQCFNIDTKFPIYFKSSSSGSHFGYSIASYKLADQIRIFVGAPKSNTNLYQNVHETGSFFVCTNFDLNVSNVSNACSEVNIQPQTFSVQRPEAPREYPSARYINTSMTPNMFLGGDIQIHPSSSSASSRYASDAIDVGSICAHDWIDENRLDANYHNLHPTGRCWIFDPKSGQVVKSLFPFSNYRKQFIGEGKSSNYYYSHSTCGVSTSFSPDGRQLYIGAPGFYNWRGSFASYSLSDRDLDESRDRTLRNVNVFETDTRVKSESYSGYSIVSGNFGRNVRNSRNPNNNVDVIFGAPRDNNYRGKVYRVIGNSIQTLINGATFGEYFGASLLAVDVNGDKLDDLLVGAPFYSPSRRQFGDRGRVYVYLNNGNNGFKINSPTILTGFRSLSQGNGRPDARFGSTMISVGDINKDGVDDVAIGAPYEDINGVVYIYHGKYIEGLINEYSQRIVGRDINSDLFGFGQGLSHNTLDADNNGYNDILIGSYLSDAVILLRSKPIVSRMDVNHKFGVRSINLSDYSCINHIRQKSACFNYKFAINRDVRRDKNVNLDIEFGWIKIIFIIDGKFPSLSDARGYFENTRSSVYEIYQKPSKDKSILIQGKIFMKSDVLDKLSPLNIKIIYQTNITNNVTYHTFCRHCAIYDVKYSDAETSFDIPIATGCGGATCKANLKHSTLLSRAPVDEILSLTDVNDINNFDGVQNLVSGNESNLILYSMIQNVGESSYNTKLVISVTPMMASNFKSDKNCSNLKLTDSAINKTLTIECDIGNPLDAMNIVTIIFDIEKMDAASKNMTFNVSLSSSSDLVSDSETVSTTIIGIKRYASINIDGHQKSQSLYSDGDDDDDKNGDAKNLVPFHLMASITKLNFSVVNRVKARLRIPISIRDVHADPTPAFASEDDADKHVKDEEITNHEPFIFKPKFVYSSSVNIFCDGDNLKWLPNLPADDDHQPDADEPSTASLISPSFDGQNVSKISTFTRRRRRRRQSTDADADHNHNHTSFAGDVITDKKLVIDCDNDNIRCVDVHCFIGPFGSKVSTIASLELHSGLIMSTIRNDFGSNHSLIELIIDFEAKIVDEVDNYQEAKLIKLISTFKRQTKSESVQTWVLIVSSGAGLLILAIVIVCLITFGFFKRKTKEDFEKELKAEEEKLVQNIHSNVDSSRNVPEIPDINDDANYESSFDHHNSERSYSFI